MASTQLSLLADHSHGNVGYVLFRETARGTAVQDARPVALPRAPRPRLREVPARPGEGFLQRTCRPQLRSR